MYNNLIIKYIVENDKIVVKYVNAKEEKYNYSKEQELEIKNIIKKQIDNYSVIKNYFNKKIKNSIIWLIIVSLIITLNVHLLIISYFNFIACLSVFFMSLCAFFNGVDIKNNISILNNLNQIKKEIDNESVLNNINNEKSISYHKEITQIKKINNIKTKKLVLKK